ncbi:TPA: biopolymer transporter ExbD [Vibrio vulnificus]|nr:biopolymer transporter ExbD [Vibrio vulnificus]EWS68898.1 biopolymer transporter ExbD [Vibrio vulnificus BAA87]ALM72842.1 Biopolymer transport protein ExbD1 [Vibrio vulnificus]ANH65203.1 Biopolymer transport protein ExbD1 [Vibrio vulnificus]ANN28417.1 Biopolymer transport protein ExbD1 [Vibrio vulnificus]ASC58966.1 Biopolymer transport protein ExbD1 [Vibrio vulnificus]
MIKVPQSHQDSGLTPDLTPLLDIIFIVMVFLMLTAAVKLESIDVNLPSSDSKVVSPVDKQSLTINILADEPHWAINGQRYLDWQNFTLALTEETKNSDKPVVIGADKTADIQHLVTLLAFLQEKGIKATQLLTDQPQ